MSSRERAGIIWVLLAAAGFSVMPTLVKITFAHSTFSPMDIAIWRFLFAVPLMWMLVLASRRNAPRKSKSDAPVRQTVLIGMLLSAAVLLFYSYPAMVVLLSRLLGEPIGARAWLALALALTGVVLTVPDFQAAGGVDKLGVALVLANAAIVAIYYLLSRRALAGVVDISGASAWMMLGTLFVLALLIPLRGLQMPPNALTLLMLLGIATLGTVLPVFGINLAIQRIGAAQASLISTVEPPLSMLVSMFVLGELILALQWVGAGLIIGSVVVLQLRPRNRLDISIAHEAG